MHNITMSISSKSVNPLLRYWSFFSIFIDRVAGATIRLVASVCVCVCVSVRLSAGALLFEPFDL